MKYLNQLDCFLLHIHQQFIHPATEKSIKHHARDCHRNTRCSSDQRLGNATCNHGWITNALTANAGKHIDHTDDRTKQTQKRGNCGDRTQRVQKTFEIRNRVASGILYCFLDNIAAMLPVYQAGGENLSIGARDRPFVVSILALSSSLLASHWRTCGINVEGITYFRWRDQRRSPMMAMAAIEQRMMGHMTQPPVFTNSNIDLLFPVTRLGG